MTPDSEALLALALRVEALAGGCIVTDAIIARALERGPDVDYYTASIDAAVTLVPDGFAWGTHHRLTVPGMKANAQCWTKEDRSTVHGDAATPALALTAAALRARAQITLATPHDRSE